MPKTTAIVDTKYGASYAKRLVRHFAHKIPATMGDQHASIEFPFGMCQVDFDETHMRIVVELSDAGQMDRAERVVADHLLRMANKDEPVVTWGRSGDRQDIEITREEK